MERSRYKIHRGLQLENVQFHELLSDAGAQAEVWSARDLNVPRVVAVKIITWPDSDVASPTTLADWDAEARSWVAISDHQNVATLLAYHPDVPFDVDGQRYHARMLIMELAEGSIDDFLRSSWPSETPTMLRWMWEITRALERAHEIDPPLVHRDIKPGNVLLYRESASTLRAALSDFGIARRTGDEASRRWIGTVPYAAPEQRSGSDPRPESDIYGLGMTLLHMLLGRKFRNAIGREGVFLRDRIPRVAAHLEDDSIARDLLDLIETMLEEEAAGRPGVASVRLELERVIQLCREQAPTFLPMGGVSSIEGLRSLAHRFVWNPTVHEAFGERLFFYFVRGFLSIQNMHETLARLVDPVVKGRYCIYEVYGTEDLVMRVWLNEELEKKVKDLFESISRLISGDVDRLDVDDLSYHWGSSEAALDRKDVSKELRAALGAPDPERALEDGPLVVGRIASNDPGVYEPGVLKAFTRVESFDSPDPEQLYSRTRAALERSALRDDAAGVSPIQRVTFHLAKTERRDVVLLKFHARDYYAVQRVPYMLHHSLHEDEALGPQRRTRSARGRPSTAVRTDTYLVTAIPHRESDDGPFFDREL